MPLENPNVQTVLAYHLADGNSARVTALFFLFSSSLSFFLSFSSRFLVLVPSTSRWTASKAGLGSPEERRHWCGTGRWRVDGDGRSSLHVDQRVALVCQKCYHFQHQKASRTRYPLTDGRFSLRRKFWQKWWLIKADHHHYCSGSSGSRSDCPSLSSYRRDMVTAWPRYQGNFHMQSSTKIMKRKGRNDHPTAL